MSQNAGWGVMVSHRSGETEDSGLAPSESTGSDLLALPFWSIESHGPKR